jgi:DNA-directed RNA polymerase specialized sigma24 family protein
MVRDEVAAELARERQARFEVFYESFRRDFYPMLRSRLYARNADESDTEELLADVAQKYLKECEETGDRFGMQPLTSLEIETLRRVSEGEPITQGDADLLGLDEISDEVREDLLSDLERALTDPPELLTKSWFFTVVINSHLDFIRKKKAKKRAVELVEHESEDGDEGRTLEEWLGKLKFSGRTGEVEDHQHLRLRYKDAVADLPDVERLAWVTLRDKWLAAEERSAFIRGISAPERDLSPDASGALKKIRMALADLAGK